MANVSMFATLINNWKITRRFPIRWLTYRTRIQLDVDEAFNLPSGKEIFDHDYVERADSAIKQLEAWQVKMMTTSFAISAFLVTGFITDDATVSLFGVSLKQAVGLKEVLLALSATIGVFMTSITQSKETLIAVLEKLTQLSTDREVLPLAALATRSSFHLKFYVPRQYDKWILPTFFTMLYSLLLGLLWIIVVLFMLAAVFGLTAFLAIQIYRHPTLGIWSTAILYYVGVVFMLSIFSTLKLILPMPYRDKSDLKKMLELETTNPAEYLALRRKYFGT
jgi:hypothetical protein